MHKLSKDITARYITWVANELWSSAVQYYNSVHYIYPGSENSMIMIELCLIFLRQNIQHSSMYLCCPVQTFNSIIPLLADIAMPLWSVEEWRARIGSCWCALGRPFNTRFTRNRGKSRRVLTLRQLLTMVIMMMLLIVANLILCSVDHRTFPSELNVLPTCYSR